ncbi:MAG TPA: type II secretion system protein [Verrucomicrobiae bacterium]|jgi:prepilin-type N-terminal cleavage/methylation domain-containing protein/prepilin-type processing-associated H-X9-DG protein
MRTRRARAFTLVEMLVTIAIIAALASLLMPALGRGKEAGRTTVCRANLHQIGVALQLYVDDNRNLMPVMYDRRATGSPTNLPAMDVVLAPQLGSTQALRCPSDGQQIFQQTGSSYSWNNLVNGENADHLQIMNLSLAMTRIPLVLDKQSFHAALGPSNAVNYLYADGHIKNRLIMAGPQ